MGEILGSDLIPGVPEAPSGAPSPPIVDPQDPDFFTQQQMQLDQMAALLELLRQLRNR